MILIYNNIDVTGIIITDDSGPEVFDVSIGKSCQLPQLPDNRYSHTQVIFDNIVSIHMNIALLEWKVGLWRIVYLRHLFTTS